MSRRSEIAQRGQGEFIFKDLLPVASGLCDEGAQQ